MTTACAPRTCKRCGRHYTAKPGRADLRRHRYGVCSDCRLQPINARSRVREYTNITPISDEDDDTRPSWRYRTPTGVVILLPDDLEAMTKRLSHYFTNRFGSRPDVVFELDDDLQPSGRGMAVGPTSRRVYARFTMQRIETGSAV